MRLDETNTVVLISVFCIHKVGSHTRKTIFCKNDHFCLMILGTSAIDRRSNLVVIATGTGYGLLTAFLDLLQLDFFRDIADFLRKGKIRPL